MLSTRNENYYSKFAANIWQYTENHTLAEHDFQQLKLNKHRIGQRFGHIETN